MKTIINTSLAPAAVGPYEQAILVDNTLYISGQIPINPENGQMVCTTYAEATQQVMKNIAAILREAQMSLSEIVRCTIFVNDLSHFSEVNEMYESFFTSNFPSRECVQVTALPKGAMVEISAIAVK